MRDDRAIVRRAAWFVMALAWFALAFWTLSFGFSDSFFRWSPGSRLPPFLAALGAAMAIPASALRQWRRCRSGRAAPLAAWLVHVVTSAASLAPLAVLAGVLARAPEPFHLSGDDAMGVGIDFLLLVALAVVLALLLGGALLVARKRPPAAS